MRINVAINLFSGMKESRWISHENSCGERQRDIERQRERETKRKRERDRETERDTETERKRETGRERDKEIETEIGIYIYI